MVLKDIGTSGRQAARDKALEARRARAEVKTQFAAGKISLEEIFTRADEEPAIGRMRCVDLIMAKRGVGQVRAQKIMTELNITLNRRLRGLGRRQRQALIAWNAARSLNMVAN